MSTILYPEFLTVRETEDIIKDKYIITSYGIISSETRGILLKEGTFLERDMVDLVKPRLGDCLIHRKYDGQKNYPMYGLTKDLLTLENYKKVRITDEKVIFGCRMHVSKSNFVWICEQFYPVIIKPDKIYYIGEDDIVHYVERVDYVSTEKYFEII